MPQLDKVTFFSQLLYFFIVFFGLYFISFKKYLPTINGSLKIRKELKDVFLKVQETTTISKRPEVKIEKLRPSIKEEMKLYGVSLEKGVQLLELRQDILENLRKEKVICYFQENK
jgi:hypothetical protein